MDVFFLTLNQMLMMFTLILVGYILRKKKILPDSSVTTLSRLETYFLTPALSLSNMMQNATVETLSKNFKLVIYGFVFIAAAVLLSYPLSNLFVKKSTDSALEYQRNIFKYAMAFGNFGYVGNFVVLGILGSEGLFKFMLFTFGLSIVTNIWGIYILTPKISKYSSIKTLFRGLLTPPIIGLMLGILIGLLNLSRFVPAFLSTALTNAANCMGPIGMILAGLVVGGYNLKELITNKKVYLATFMRLVVIPSVMMFVLRAFGESRETMILVLMAFAVPLGLNTIIFPAAYGGDTKPGASMAMISHALSVITIPLMYLLFIVLM